MDHLENEHDAKEEATLVRIFHRNESQLYHLFQELESPPIPIPKIYLCRDCDLMTKTANDHEFSVIVMEDLRKYSLIDIINGFNDKQLYSIMDAIVDLHVYSFTHVGWEQVGFFESEIDESMSMENTLNGMVTALKKLSPKHFEKVDLLLELSGEHGWNRKYMKKCVNDEYICALVHGDLWPANIMWDGNKLKAIIDWQLAHKGIIVEDIMRVLSTSVSVDTRKRLTKPLLHYYYYQLADRMSNLRLEMPFAFEDVQKSYRLALPYAALCTVFAAAFWSNSAVLKDEKNPENQARRMKEIFDRTESIIEDAVHSFHASS